MKRLVAWFWSEFVVDDALPGVRTRSYGDVQRELTREGVFDLADLLCLLDGDRAKQADVAVAQPFGPAEVIRNAQSLMKRAVQLKGSKDMAAQLFTALCRAIGIPARLVFSLQPVDWRATAAATEPSSVPKGRKRKRGEAEPSSANSKGKGKGKARASATTTEDDNEEDDDSDLGEFEPVVAGASSSRPISVASDTESRPISVASTEDEGETAWGSRHGGPPIRLRKSKPVKRDRSASPGGSPSCALAQFLEK
jgi:xeroderma pigmentosum group C-complementing protein